MKLMKRDVLTGLLLVAVIVLYFNPADSPTRRRDLCVVQLAMYVSAYQNTDLRTNQTVARLLAFLICYNEAVTH